MRSDSGSQEGKASERELTVKFFEVEEVDEKPVVNDEKILGVKKPRFIEDNAELSEYWDEIVPRLTGLSSEDEWAISMMVMHYRAAQRAFEALEDTEMFEIDREGDVRKNPLESVFRAESAAFLKYASMFGMTARSRAVGRTVPNSNTGPALNPFRM